VLKYTGKEKRVYTMKNKILGILLTMLLIAQVAIAAPFSGNAKTKRIPAGTKLELKLLNPVGTGMNAVGSSFNAMLLTDQKAEDDVILPMGSIVRGNIRAITPSKRMSKGAILYLEFDHVVTPNGRQLPLTLNIVGRSDITFDGGLTTTRGYSDAWKQTCQKSGQITKNAVSWGEDVTNDSGWKYVVVPFSAAGGAIGSAGYFVYDSIADMIRKGKDVQLNIGEVLNVILVEPVDIPVI